MTAHREHPNPGHDKEFAAEGDPTKIPAGVNVPNADRLFRPWHIWLVYGMAFVTISTATLTGYTYARQRTDNARITDNVTRNTDLICGAARIRQTIDPATPQERALRQLTATTDASCVRTHHS